MRLSEVIYEFCAAHVGEKTTMKEISAHVQSKISVAPGSEARMLRRLRADGKLSYNVPDPKISEYLITAVN